VAVHVIPYDPGADAEWDALVGAAPMATFLHTRRFLAYHGDRFEDASVVVRDDGGRLTAVLPAAVDPADRTRVTSHPGATFGGIVHDGSLVGAAMLDALGSLREHYRSRGFERLVYAPVPLIYHRRPSADDVYALFRAGAARVRCNLSCAIDLQGDQHRSSRRRRGLAKARRLGVEVTEGADRVGELWPILEENLARRHSARPAHSDDEMRLLTSLFPDAIEVVLARHDERPVAGVVVFDSPRVSRAQYIASSEAGHAVHALDAVLDHCLTRAAERGARYFDFGTSNLDGGRVLNTGLYEFKAQFGGGGVAYDTYDVDLSGTPSTS
jgi:hypothetical protein